MAEMTSLHLYLFTNFVYNCVFRKDEKSLLNGLWPPASHHIRSWRNRQLRPATPPNHSKPPPPKNLSHVSKPDMAGNPLHPSSNPLQIHPQINNPTSRPWASLIRVVFNKNQQVHGQFKPLDLRSEGAGAHQATPSQPKPFLNVFKNPSQLLAGTPAFSPEVVTKQKTSLGVITKQKTSPGVITKQKTSLGVITKQKTSPGIITKQKRRPGSQPSKNHRPRFQPSKNHRPGSQPSKNHCPGSQPSKNHRPGSQPSKNHRPRL